jgi:hypothetical protein
MPKRILFLVAAVALAAAGFYFRSQSSHTAHSQAASIVQADAAGNDVATQIASLKDFVKLHMGASVSFSLKGSFDRADAAAKAAAAAPDPNAKIYADAQKACSGKSDSITQAKCNSAYLQQHLSTAPTPTPVAAPVAADYSYKLAAPLWSPDLAGALFLGAVAALVMGYFFGQPRQVKR